MIKTVKTVCLFAVLTASIQTDLVATKIYKRPTSLDIIFSLESYVKSGALFDIINNHSWNKHKKMMAVINLFKQSTKPDPNKKDNDGFPVLHRAIENRLTKIVKFLIRKDANKNERNRIQNSLTEIAYTPLQWAILKGKNGIAKFLINKGVNINFKTSNGWPTLHIAVAKGDKGTIRLLLNKNTPIGEKDTDGNTALHIAAFYANKSVLQLLVSRGIDHTEKNKRGFTAADILAFGCKNPDCFKGLGISGEEFAICHAYIKLVTDFFTTLKTMQESTSMFSFFDEAHITETFDRFKNTYLTGMNAKQNSKAIRKLLALDKKKDFAERFTKWRKKQRTNTRQTPAT